MKEEAIWASGYLEFRRSLEVDHLDLTKGTSAN